MNILLNHEHQHTVTRNLIFHSIKWTKVVLGLLTKPFNLLYNTHGKYLSHSWLIYT